MDIQVKKKQWVFILKIVFGFGISFIPYLLPNGRLWFPLGLAFRPLIYLNFFLPLPVLFIIFTMIVYRVRKRKGVLGWIVGALSALVTGDILFWVLRFNYVP